MPSPKRRLTSPYREALSRRRERWMDTPHPQWPQPQKALPHAGRPVRVLFVCHGNICRSPMAEYILRQMAAGRGLSARLEVASAAAHTDELGHDVYPPARRTLAAHGVPCPARQARLLCAEDYARYDRIVGMDSENWHDMQALFRADPAGKLRLLLPRPVADPWYTGDFEQTYADLVRGCGALLDELF